MYFFIFNESGEQPGQDLKKYFSPSQTEMYLEMLKNILFFKKLHFPMITFLPGVL